MFSKKYIFILIFFLFFISRWYIISHPAFDEKRPNSTYSDVKHDYERYANMWYYGYTPYLKHYFEYPPATIPLILTPLIFDQNGIGKYYPNYRVEILIIDSILFFLSLLAILKIKTSKRSKYLAVGFLLIAPMIAKDFYYEGIDVAFITSICVAIISLLLFNQKNIFLRIFFWSFFWLSVAIKFMSFPLLIPFFYLKKLSLKKEILACLIGFLIIWAVPLALF